MGAWPWKVAVATNWGYFPKKEHFTSTAPPQSYVLIISQYLARTLLFHIIINLCFLIWLSTRWVLSGLSVFLQRPVHRDTESRGCKSVTKVDEQYLSEPE